jgi:arsenate reductase (thioredoxin)
MKPQTRPQAFITHPPVKVLFLCTHNAARSQIAEGFARAIAPPEVVVWSAGTEPSSVHPLAIEVMKEVGVDISAQRSKQIDGVPWREMDTVVTLCGDADERCPTLDVSVRRVHWPLPDPAAAPAERLKDEFREVRDEIHWRVASLWPRGD